MKRILILALALIMVLTMVACGTDDGKNTDTDPIDLGTDSNTEANNTEPNDTEPVDTTPSENKGELKAGVYTATSSYATEGMNMTWNFVLTLKADNTFTLTNDAGDAKGEGTYALTDKCYTLTYSDNRTATFVVQEDGKLKLTTDFPFGMATIQLALVGDIIFTFDKEIADDSGSSEGGNEQGGTTTETFTIAAGTYAGVYQKVSQMAGTVDYKYTAVVGADGTFSYSVKFAMGGTEMDGSSANGTYTVDGNKFVFTDSANNVIEGKLTANNTLVISLKASQMASEPYEVTLTPAVYTIEAGTYRGIYQKVSPMAGTVIYVYTATVGADGAFSYSVKFTMGTTEMDGSSATGTYTLNGNKFVFTDSANNVIEGTLTANNTLVISLKASQMAAEPYEITFTPAVYTIGAGMYSGVYQKVSQMAGTVNYVYTATVGADGTFSYSVKFAMGGTEMDGSSASGTYTVNGNKFVFTDSANNVIEGVLTDDNTLVISLKASQMAAEPYEVTLTPAYVDIGGSDDFVMA